MVLLSNNLQKLAKAHSSTIQFKSDAQTNAAMPKFCPCHLSHLKKYTLRLEKLLKIEIPVCINNNLFPLNRSGLVLVSFNNPLTALPVYTGSKNNPVRLAISK